MQDGIHEASTGVEIRVKDVQNRPPVFQGSLAAVINEDSPIGTLVMTIQAKDGDHGQPRKIVYDLLTSKYLIDYHMFFSVFILRTNLHIPHRKSRQNQNVFLFLFVTASSFRSNGLLFAECKNRRITYSSTT